jgi:hypothetical protein
MREILEAVEEDVNVGERSGPLNDGEPLEEIRDAEEREENGHLETGHGEAVNAHLLNPEEVLNTSVQDPIHTQSMVDVFLERSADFTEELELGPIETLPDLLTDLRSWMRESVMLRSSFFFCTLHE